jgi:transcriptional regulator with XRE-family HTH domain
LTQAELAEACGLSNNFIALLERGKNAPSIETLDALSRAFKITISELFEFAINSEGASERDQIVRKLSRVSNRRDLELIHLVVEFIGREHRMRQPR